MTPATMSLFNFAKHLGGMMGGVVLVGAPISWYNAPLAHCSESVATVASPQTVVGVGDLVECKLTGIQGIVVYTKANLYSVSRICVEPTTDYNGAPITDAKSKINRIVQDLPQTTLITKGFVDHIEPSSRVKLGDKCVDRISGFTGICTGKVTWLYGCTTIILDPGTIDPKTLLPVDNYRCAEGRLDVVTKNDTPHIPTTTGGDEYVEIDRLVDCDRDCSSDRDDVL